jgi:catechol 2,3-dioxygenase-like lactoylglutathione lyase family enzyme
MCAELMDANMHHIAISVENLDRGVKFYRNILRLDVD